jgi:dimethylaniline monooxygenase (N-oxide forming)
VWSKRRIYPSFWSQWAYGIAEFADMPMERPPAEDSMNDLFKAKYTMKYIEDYADNRKFAGRSLRDRVQFNTNVKSVEKVDSRWQLSCTMSKEGGTQKDIFAARLMVANGQASTPRMPDLPGKEKFAGLIMHSVDWGQADVLTNEKIKNVVVLGGGKSAADMVYESAKAGKTVSWNIRKTGPKSTGPGFFAPLDVPVPEYDNPGLAAQSRVMARLQPTFLNQDTWWTRFLHGTNFGVSLVKRIFGLADAQLQKRARYKERGLEKLKYEVE